AGGLVLRGMVAGSDDATPGSVVGRCVEGALSQGDQQEAASQGEEGEVFGGSYFGPKAPGRRAPQAERIQGWAVSEVVQSSGSALPGRLILPRPRPRSA